MKKEKGGTQAGRIYERPRGHGGKSTRQKQDEVIETRLGQLTQRRACDLIGEKGLMTRRDRDRLLQNSVISFVPVTRQPGCTLVFEGLWLWGCDHMAGRSRLMCREWSSLILSVTASMVRGSFGG